MTTQLNSHFDSSKNKVLFSKQILCTGTIFYIDVLNVFQMHEMWRLTDSSF